MMHKTELTSGSAATTPEPLAIDRAQPAWMTLDDARERSFTGELVFEGNPDVLAYLDHGIVYFAEAADAAALGQRLLDAGLVDAAQLERGTVRVGDIEHLGRLFDRDPSIDRDAVLVMTEAFTEDVVMRLANNSVSNVRVTAYRHHPSGLHRWFVAPVDAVPAPRPIGAGSPLDSAVLDDLPGMGRSVDDLVEELTIEWDEPLDGADPIEILPAVDELDDQFGPDDADDTIDTDDTIDADDTVDADDTIDTDDTVDADEPQVPEFANGAGNEPAAFDMASYVDLETDDGSAALPLTGALSESAADAVDVEPSTAVDPDADEPFDVIWPDGSVDVATDRSADDVATEALVDDVETTAPGEVSGLDAPVHFDIPDFAVSDDDDVATDEATGDVADAVRRALAAIETASVAPLDAAPTPADQDPSTTPVLAPESVVAAETGFTDAVDAAQIAETEVADSGLAGPEPMAPAATSPFAPPTLETSAEAIYARAAADGAVGDTGQPAPEAGKASVVFVDDDSTDGGDRSSALRRLIRSLGRKDR